jgi:two-component system sensor histidine kinase/response regulator
MTKSNEHLRALFDALPASILVIDEGSIIQGVNPAAERLLGHDAAGLVGQRVALILPALDGDGASPGSGARRTVLGMHRDGTALTLELLRSEMRVGTERYAVLLLEDVSAHTRAEARLRYRLELESAVAEISHRFVQADGDSLDAVIDWAVARMSTLTGVDRGYVFLLSEDGATFRNSHEWCAEGIPPQIDDIGVQQAAEFQNIIVPMQAGEMIHVERVADMPDGEGPLKEILIAGDIQSFIIVPIAWDGRLRGFLGFDAVRARKRFPEEDIRLLRTVAEIMSRAMAHHEAARRIAEDAWLLEHLDRVARIFARNRDLGELLQELAELLLETFQADRAWLSHPCDPDAASFRVPVEATRPGCPGAFGTLDEVPMDDGGRSLTRAILASDEPLTFDFSALAERPPFAARFDIQSAMVMGVRPRGEQAWAVGLHQCAYPRQWSDRERRLFQAIGERMSEAFSLHLMNQKVRLSESRFAFMLQSNPAIVYAVSMVRPVRYTYISQSVQDILGYPPEEVLRADDWMEGLMHPADLDWTVARIRDALAREGRATVTYRVRKRDGAYLWLQDQMILVRDGGAIPQVIGCIIDITPRVHAEQELERARAAAERALTTAEERLRLLEMAEEVAHFGHWRVELATGALSWSKELYRIHGMSPADAPPPDLDKILDEYYPHDMDIIRGTLAMAMAERRVVISEAKLVLPDGSRRWLQTHAAPEIDAREDVVGLFGVTHDITNRKQTEQALVRAREEALAASRVKSQFLANMSHEIRTPLNGVLGLTELLLDSPLSAEQRELLEMVRSSGRTLHELLEDVLDISKIEAGKLELEAVPFALRDVVQDAARTVAVRAHEKGLELVVDVAPDVPGRVVGDPVRFRQILTNLLANAVKFTPRGEIELLVQPGDDGGVAVSVRDTGIGISPERRQAIFEAFTQADGSTTREYGGSGLGLAICRELVERMGGRIWVEPAAGGGSVFRFLVALPAAEGAREPATATSPLVGARALIVEDNPTTSGVLARLLRAWSMEPVVCADAREALAVAHQSLDAERGFRFALIDTTLGTPSGVELATTLARDPRLAGVTRILLASASWRQDPALLSDGIVSRCLIKPLSPSTLLDALLSGTPAAALALEGQASEIAARRLERPGLRVLLAEDNPMNALLIKRILARSECSLVHVTTGTAALAAWESQRFDVILMDMQMPEIDGLEATRRIRARERERGGYTPIVALTANAMQEDEQRCRDAGMDEYLPKPIEIEQLFHALARIQRLRPRPQAFDARALLDQVGDDREIAALLVASFLGTEGAVFAGIEAALAAGDMSALEHAAHHARGSLLALHAQPAATAALAVELAARNGEHAQLAAAVAELREAWNVLLDELRAGSLGKA